MLIGVLLLSLATHAQFSADGGMADRADRLARAPQFSLYNSNSWSNRYPEEYKNCRRQYDEFFADGTLRVSMALGYHDWPKTDRTLDQETFRWVQNTLTRECPTELDTLCGFQQSETPYVSKFIFHKKIGSYEGSQASSLNIRLEMAYSSYSSYDSENFNYNKISPEQLQTSRIAEDLFFGGISGQDSAGQPQTPCEVCTYLGHARNGGGPDFRPVPLDWANSDREPNYSYYLKNKANYRKLLAALLTRQTNDHPLIAILGCNSFKKFYTEDAAICVNKEPNCQKYSLKSFSTQTSFVLTRALSWPQNRPYYLASVFESVTSLKCRTSVIKSLKTVSENSENPEAYELFGRYLGDL